MPQIIPINQLKNTSAISEKCNASVEPIFVTKNGYGDMVLMSMKLYEQTMAKLHAAEAINSSVREVEQGAEPIDGKSAMQRLRAKYE